MNTKIISFETIGYKNEPQIYKLTGKSEDIIRLFKKACEKAAKDGFRGFNYEIPKKYLQSYDLKMERIDTETVDMEYLGEDNMLVKLCTCSQCSAYEEGSCYKYGGIVDGFSTGDDCLHGTGGYRLNYDGSSVSDIIFETELTPEEAVSYIMKSNEPDLEDLKSEIIEFFEDDGIDSAEKNLWSFEEDHF